MKANYAEAGRDGIINTSLAGFIHCFDLFSLTILIILPSAFRISLRKPLSADKSFFISIKNFFVLSFLAHFPPLAAEHSHFPFSRAIPVRVYERRKSEFPRDSIANMHQFVADRGFTAFQFSIAI